MGGFVLFIHLNLAKSMFDLHLKMIFFLSVGNITFVSKVILQLIHSSKSSSWVGEIGVFI